MRCGADGFSGSDAFDFLLALPLATAPLAFFRCLLFALLFRFFLPPFPFFLLFALILFFFLAGAFVALWASSTPGLPRDGPAAKARRSSLDSASPWSVFGRFAGRSPASGERV